MRRRLTIALLVSLLAAGLQVVPAPSALGAKPPLKCSKQEMDGRKFRICKGFVRAKDGTVKLDTVVTLPPRGDGPFPLILMNHGLGGNKSSFMSETIQGSGGSYHYNNLWFARHGYAVINYTARGFDRNECLDPSQPAADADPDLYGPSPACGPQMDHKDHEAKDSQFLIGKAVDGTLVSADVEVARKKIGATGVSYGGGQTWQLARMNRWRSPQGRKITLRAAVPIIGWTDLGDALIPNGMPYNGHIPPTDVTQRMAERIGVAKASYVSAFHVLMAKEANTPFDLPDYIDEWKDRVLAGPPYDDAVMQDAVESLLVNRSPYYMPQKNAFDTAVLTTNGWTDHIFGAAQSVHMFNRMKSEDPGYPLRVYLGDWGHPIAQNTETDLQHQAGLVNAWLKHYVKGKGIAPESLVESRSTACPGNDTGRELAAAPTFEGLQGPSLPVDLTLTGTLDAAADDPHKTELDPADQFASTNNRCRVTDTAVATGNLAAELELEAGLSMLGFPTVTLTADPSREDMYVAFRVWDVDAAGESQTLVDRGVWRLASAESQAVVARLHGNHYRFAPGHSLKLEVTANDSPSFLDEGPGTIDISAVTMMVPTTNPASIVPE